MDKRTRNKLVKQICRLCEKQYRKGFQHGYFACKENILTENEANEFRWKGAIEEYRKVECPLHWNSKANPIDRVYAETAMEDMNELRCFLRGVLL